MLVVGSYKEKYQRPPYGDKCVATTPLPMRMSKTPIMIPKLDYPITPRENFHRNLKRDNPRWATNSLVDCEFLFAFEVIGCPDNIFGIGPNDWTDMYGCDWRYVPVAGGSMLRPGTQVLNDVTKWRDVIKLPNLDDYDIKGLCKKFIEERHDPDKAVFLDIGLGCTERFIAFMGGYTDGMLAFATEPEAVRNFYEVFADYLIDMFDRIADNLPIDMLTYHDD